MNPVIARRTVLSVGMAVGASLVVPRARACEFFTTHLRVTHPWTRASVAGATTAIVCMKFDEVIESDRLIAVETSLADGAVLTVDASTRPVDFAIPKGRETLLGETGTVLRLVGLRQAIENGRAYPLRLVFEKGGPIDADLSVDYEPFG